MRWKRTRYELIGGIGTASFMGDLGGGSNANRDSRFAQMIGDIDLLTTRPSIYAGMRYKLSPSFALKFSLTYGMISGNDAYSEDSSRIVRNLNFRSVLFENSLLLEYSIIKESDSRKWSKKRKRIKRGFSANWYVFTGVGGFYFNPKSQVRGEGPWIALQPIGTQGQTFTTAPDGSIIPKKGYSRYLPCFPIGTGIKIGITRRIDIGAEWGGRITLTDNIDDVNGELGYADNETIIKANGGNVNAGWLADNHLSPPTRAYANNTDSQYYKEGDRIPYNEGAIRGGVAKDYYLFFIFNISYKLKTQRNGLPKFR